MTNQTEKENFSPLRPQMAGRARDLSTRDDILLEHAVCK